MPRPRPRRDPCDCRDCLEDGEIGAATAAALQQGGGIGFLDGIVDKEEPSATTSTSTSTPALTGTRAARQDPPPRALVLLCDGMLSGLIDDSIERSRAESVSEAACSSSSSFPHLDAVARGGAVGTLALRSTTGAEADDPRLIRHAALFQLLGAHLPPPPPYKNKKKKRRPLYERFLGLSAALVTTDAAAAAAAEEDSFGGLEKVETFSVLPPSSPAGEASFSPFSSPASVLAARVSSLLGIGKPMQEKKKSVTEEENDDDDDDNGSFDLAFVHLTRAAFPDGDDGNENNSAQDALSFADSFLQKVRSAQGALDDRGDDALIVVVIFSSSSGEGEEEDEGEGKEPILALPPRGGSPLLQLESSTSALIVPRPAQSFEFAQGKKVEIRNEALLVASRCDGVLRVDGARRLLKCVGESVKSRKRGCENERGDEAVTSISPGSAGLGCVLAEHLLDEISYKLGRSLKYGV